MKRDLEEGAIQFQYNSCPCGSGEEETFSEVDRLGVCFRYVICRDCGLIRANPFMTKESTGYFYGRYYENLYHKYSGHPPLSYDEVFDRGVARSENTILPMLEYPKNKEILMIGGRTGAVLYPFLEYDNRVHLIDYEKDSLEYAKRKGIVTYEGDYKDIELSQKFDIIILDSVAEHFLDIKKELVHLHKLLSEDGLVLINVPDAGKMDTIYTFSDVRKEIILCHSYYFSKESLENTAAMVGFELQKSQYRVLPHFLMCLYRKGERKSDGIYPKGSIYEKMMNKLFWTELRYKFFKAIHLEYLQNTFEPKFRNNKIVTGVYRKLFH
jgi:hypothetical protein